LLQGSDTMRLFGLQLGQLGISRSYGGGRQEQETDFAGPIGPHLHVEEFPGPVTSKRGYSRHQGN
jgi:hypothetical protein